LRAFWGSPGPPPKAPAPRHEKHHSFMAWQGAFQGAAKVQYDPAYHGHLRLTHVQTPFMLLLFCGGFSDFSTRISRGRTGGHFPNRLPLEWKKGADRQERARSSPASSTSPSPKKRSPMVFAFITVDASFMATGSMGAWFGASSKWGCDDPRRTTCSLLDGRPGCFCLHGARGNLDFWGFSRVFFLRFGLGRLMANVR